MCCNTPEDIFSGWTIRSLVVDDDQSFQLVFFLIIYKWYFGSINTIPKKEEKIYGKIALFANATKPPAGIRFSFEKITHAVNTADAPRSYAHSVLENFLVFFWVRNARN